jgi:hypothetical protein
VSTSCHPAQVELLDSGWGEHTEQGARILRFEADGARPARYGEHSRGVRSGAAVAFFLGERGDADGVARELFGRRLQPWEYAGLAGAPDDALVEVGTLGRWLYLELSGPPEQAYRAFQLVLRVGRSLVVANDGFHIFRKRQQGRGLGIGVFARQLDHARRLGICRIETVAGRRSNENGYYTWPRFGFDGRLPPSIRESLPAGLNHCQSVLDVMDREAGRDWWRAHGISMPVTFDVTSRSRSWVVFRRYLREGLGRGSD